MTGRTTIPDWPMMMGEEQAAAYVSLPVATFLRSVQRGELPRPRLLAGRRRWSRSEIDNALHPEAEVGMARGVDPVLARIEQWSVA